MRTSVIDTLRATSLRHGARIAIETADEAVTYETLARAAFALRTALLERFARRGRPVAILAKKSPAAIAAIGATLMSGNVYCPLDVGAPPARVRKILDGLGDCLVLADEAGMKLLATLGIDCIDCTDGIQVMPLAWPDAAALPVLPLVALWDQVALALEEGIDLDPCYIIFTSGSTGMPKGVTIAHRGVLDYIDWANGVYRVGPEDKVGSQAPLFFDNSTLDLYLCWSNGACFHIIADKVFAFPKTIVDYLARHAITTIFWVPSVLVNIANLALLDGAALPALRRILFAGEVMPARTLKYWMARHPDALYSNLYGPTEITVDCTYYLVPPGWDGEVVPIGVPCRNSGVLVLDADDRAADEGELCVRGSGVALGYWNDPGKTEAAFVRNPLRPEVPETIYRTGDIVRRQDGLLYFVGRKDQQIKHNGYRIELGEIEAVAGAIGAVEACVAGYDAQGRQIWLAVKAADAGIDRAGLLKHLAAGLPKYMLPAKIEILSALPYTANGKFDRQALARLLCG